MIKTAVTKLAFQETDIDHSLLTLISEGDELAFRRLYTAFYPILYPQIVNFAKSGLMAEDVLQETFLRLWLNRDKIPEIQNVKGWLYRTAANICIDQFRVEDKERRKEEVLRSREIQRAKSQQLSPVEWTDNKQLEQLVKEALKQLPKSRRRIFQLSRELGMKPAEIAEELGLSVITVKNTLVTALKDVRQYLLDKGVVISLIGLAMLLLVR